MVELREGSALLHLIRNAPDGVAAGRPPIADRRPPVADRRPGADGRRTADDGRRSGERSEPTLTCGFCGQDFVEDRSQATCQACPLSKACGLMRCPHCGYENAKEPGWLARIKEWIR